VSRRIGWAKMETAPGSVLDQDSVWRRARWVFAGAALLAAGATAALVTLAFSGLGDEAVTFCGDGLQASFVAIATLCLFAGAWSARTASRRAVAGWALLGTACLAYWAADLLSLVFDLDISGTALDYLVATLYFAFYPLFLSGAALLPHETPPPELRRRLLFDTALTVVAAALALWVLVLEPGLAAERAGLGQMLVAFAFPLGDLILLWSLLRLLFGRCGRSGKTIHRILAGAAGLLIASDTLYTVQIAWHMEGLSLWITAGLTGSFLLLALAGGLRLAAGECTADAPPLRFPAPFAGSLYLSSACLVLSFGILIWSDLDHLSLVSVAMLLVLTLLVLARQVTAVRENDRLQHRLLVVNDGLEARVAERTAELDRKLREVTALRMVALLAANAQDEEGLVAEATALVRDGLFPDNCGVLLLDRSSGMLRHADSFYAGTFSPDLPHMALGKGVTGQVALTGRSRRIPDTSQDPDYVALDPAMRSELCVPIRLGDEVIGVFDAESARPAAFTESDERVLEALASQMAVALGRLRAANSLRASEARFRTLVERSDDLITIHGRDGAILEQSPSVERILGYPPGELAGKNLLDLIHPEDVPRAAADFGAVLARGSDGIPTEARVRRRDGSWIHLETLASNLLDDPAVRGLVLTSRDVSARKQADVRIRHQLEQLQALRAIDLAIGATFDLRHTLSVLLEQVTAQLGVDAADLLLLDPDSQLLTFAAGRGFDTEAVRHTHLRPGESFAGQAALERRIVHAGDLTRERGGFVRSPLFGREGFVAYFAAPLVTKGQVTGVLELFHRTPLEVDREWLDFLETLAGQAAIALDNSTLFGNLQRSNAELALAYDVTLEGWSKALELRDQETQGHAVRVTELTVRLARRAGIPEHELVHVRRGALLHDIGKMGIPDALLLKPGPLTPEEWTVMKRHVEYARDLLSPVEFLRQALDIPCGHHERWDGSGYPQGLKGESIPLAARVFAIVDIWDALRSDRPYRSAWPEEKVRAYLREQAGRLLDPQVVEHFLALDR